MEFENVCPGIMQRAPAEEPVGPVSCAPREGSGRRRSGREAVWGASGGGKFNKNLEIDTSLLEKMLLQLGFELDCGSMCMCM